MHYTALLKKLRRENGLTQQQVADCLHMDRSTYAYYELGQTKPTIEFLAGLSRLYRIRLSELIEQEPAEPSREYSEMLFSQLSRDEQKLVILYRALEPAQRRILLGAAQAPRT